MIALEKEKPVKKYITKMYIISSGVSRVMGRNSYLCVA
jgi:hypothetical protein